MRYCLGKYLLLLGALLTIHPSSAVLEGDAAANKHNAPTTTLDALRLRAEQGDAVAQYNLASSCAAGKYAAKDLKAALYWFEKSASAGLPNAQTSMGWAYMSNYLELAPDYKLAMEWNLKAANQGFGEGSSNIGQLYMYDQNGNYSYGEAR
jgi:uncharacterized protein